MSVGVEVSTETFQHETFFYGDDGEFVEYVAGFIRDGLEQDQVVAVAEPPRNIGLLRDELGADAGAVQFFDMTQIGANPARIIAVWQAFLDAQTAAGRSARGVGEPAWPGRRDAELSECLVHELLLNRAFGGGPHWRLLCPYDESALPLEVLAGALRSHPVRSSSGERVPTGHYDEDAVLAAFAAPLPPAPDTAQRHRYDVAGLAATRALIAEFAAGCRLPAARTEELVLASSELAANSARHGGGSGSLVLWREPDAMLMEFTDAGQITEPLVGRRQPPLEAISGRGIYLVNQLCDLVQLRSSADGTTVRITTWL